MSEYLLDNLGFFNAGDHFDVVDAFSAGLDFDFDVEDALEALRPEPALESIRGHGSDAFVWRLAFWLIRRFGLVALTPFSGRHQRAVLAFRDEHAVEVCAVHPGAGHQHRQPGDKAQWLFKIAGSDFKQPKAGPQDGGQDAGSNITCDIPSR